MTCLAERSDTSLDYIPFEVRPIGTGGVGSESLLAWYESGPHRPAVYEQDSATSLGTMVSPAEMLTTIRHALKLNMSDLASVLGVSRPTVYAWLGGDDPSHENYIHIVRLQVVADKVEHSGVERFEKLLKRPIFDGASFFDKLKAQEDITEPLLALKSLGDREQAARMSRKGPGKTLENLGFLEHSSPIYEV